MKLRIKANSIRLRLSQPEVQAFLQYGSISDVIEIPGGPLVYNLEKSKENTLSIHRLAGSIRVGMPESMMREWAKDECIGFDHNFEIGEDKAIYILVEKDFQCLTPREHEDESHLFPNPLASHHC